MNPRVRFDDEADAEYRGAARWYEARRVHLGVEFLDAVDAAIDQLVTMPRARRSSSVDCRQTCQSDAAP